MLLPPYKNLEDEMKKTLFLIVLLIGLLLITACSEKDDNNSPVTSNPPVMSAIPAHVLTVPDETTQYDPTLLEDIQYNDATTQALPLTYFVTKEITDQIVLASSSDTTMTQKLFAYHLIGKDGYSPRNKPLNDLTWDQLKSGYLLPSVDYQTYFPSDAIPKAYDVDTISTIKFYRAITVVKPDGEKVLWEISMLDTVTVNNHDGNPETAYNLKDLISSYITTTPANYSYVFKDNSTDGYSQTYTWEEIQDGKWLKYSQKTIFPSFTDMPNSKKKYKKLMEIHVVQLENVK